MDRERQGSNNNSDGSFSSWDLFLLRQIPLPKLAPMRSLCAECPFFFHFFSVSLSLSLSDDVMLLASGETG